LLGAKLRHLKPLAALPPGLRRLLRELDRREKGKPLLTRGLSHMAARTRRRKRNDPQ
jgi:hypothetical protein